MRIVQSFYHIITSQNEVSQVCAEHYIVVIELLSHKDLNKVRISERIIIVPSPPSAQSPIDVHVHYKFRGLISRKLN